MELNELNELKKEQTNKSGKDEITTFVLTVFTAATIAIPFLITLCLTVCVALILVLNPILALINN
jgi:uncharacterized membrane protein